MRADWEPPMARGLREYAKRGGCNVRGRQIHKRRPPHHCPPLLLRIRYSVPIVSLISRRSSSLLLRVLCARVHVNLCGPSFLLSPLRFICFFQLWKTSMLFVCSPDPVLKYVKISGRLYHWSVFPKNAHRLPVTKLTEEQRKPELKDESFKFHSCKFQLEQDVQRLERLLHEELALHMILENAVEHVTGTLDDLSFVPHEAQELLLNITTLEAAVLRLEQEIVSLRFQLIQERNERRLAEYHLKQLTSRSLFLCSPGNEEIRDAAEGGKTIKMKKASGEVHKVDLKMKKGMPIKGLWEHPNMLAEEMVRCMKDIFITLADAAVQSKPLFSGELQPSLSPNGHLSSSSWVLSEPSTVSSCGRSPQVDLQFHNEVLDVDGSFDPYNFFGKVCWADIGKYRSATEVSWMSVGKKQLEIAAVALRKFRSLIEQLAKVNPIHLSGNEKLAFWINLYNALVMHAFLAYGVPKNDLKLFSLMQKAAYTVGGHSFSATTIEYVILKMKPPIHRPQTAFFLALHKLKVSEEQRKFAIEVPEPLVAFALSCGMYSSPAVKIYTPKNVREELQEAQRDFIRASVGVSKRGKLLVPKMIYSFARGSVDDANLATWVSHFLPPQQANFVEHCMSRRRQSFLGSRSCEILPFDSKFRYLFLPEILS